MPTPVLIRPLAAITAQHDLDHASDDSHRGYELRVGLQPTKAVALQAHVKSSRNASAMAPKAAPSSELIMASPWTLSA